MFPNINNDNNNHRQFSFSITREKWFKQQLSFGWNFHSILFFTPLKIYWKNVWNASFFHASAWFCASLLCEFLHKNKLLVIFNEGGTGEWSLSVRHEYSLKEVLKVTAIPVWTPNSIHLKDFTCIKSIVLWEKKYQCDAAVTKFLFGVLMKYSHQWIISKLQIYSFDWQNKLYEKTWRNQCKWVGYSYFCSTKLTQKIIQSLLLLFALSDVTFTMKLVKIA